MNPEPLLRRLFFALWPDDATAAALHREAQAARQSCRGRATRIDTIHLTLAFLGAIEASKITALCGIAAGIQLPAFVLMIDRLGYFRGSRVLWAGCKVPPDALLRLASQLCEALRAENFTLEARAFAPHATLLRNATVDAVPTLSQAIDWPVREFALVESRLSTQGAEYHRLASWPLAQAA